MVQGLLRNLGAIIGVLGEDRPVEVELPAGEAMPREEGKGLNGIFLGDDKPVSVEPPAGEAMLREEGKGLRGSVLGEDRPVTVEPPSQEISDCGEYVEAGDARQ
jgi:hypothetical protein